MTIKGYDVRLEDGSDAIIYAYNEPPSPTNGQGSALVWRPGGTAGPGVVTTWAEVAAAIAANNTVPLSVYVDSSIAAAVIPGSSGTTDMLGTTRLLSFNWSTASISYTDMVEIQDGATLYRLREIAEGLDVLCDAVTTASLSFEGPPTIDVFTVRDFARLRTGGSAGVAAIELGAGQSLQFYTRGNVQVEALTASGLLSLSSTSILNWTVFDELTINIYASVLATGPAGSRINFIHDNTISVPAFTGFSGSVDDVRLYFAPGHPGYDPTWYAATDIYLDPANSTGLASNSNAGTSATTPLLTMGEVVQRYGSSTPKLTYGQNLTIHQLSAQTAGVDAFTFKPIQMGGGTFIWIGTPTTVGAAFSPTTVTAKLQTAVGNDLKLNGNLPAGAAAGQIVHNTMKNSYAKIVSIAAGDATVTQPLASAGLLTVTQSPVPVEDITWASTDTYQLLQPLLVNWENIQATNGDTNSAYTAGAMWVQGVEIADAEGSANHSSLAITAMSGALVFSLCTIDPSVYLSGSTNYGIWFMACSLNASTYALEPYVFVMGCYCFQELLGANLLVDCDTILNSDLYVDGTGNYLGVVHLVSGAFIEGIMVTLNVGFTGAALLWGAGTINVKQGGNLSNVSGSTFANTVKVATLELDGASTGSSFLASAADNPFTAGVALTSANVDTGGGAGNPGLQNPRTGSRFSST